MPAHAERLAEYEALLDSEELRLLELARLARGLRLSRIQARISALKERRRQFVIAIATLTDEAPPPAAPVVKVRLGH